MRDNVKWAQFVGGLYGPPPTTPSGRRMMEQRETLPKAYAHFGRDIEGFNRFMARHLSDGSETWRRPIESALSVIETGLPMVGPFVLGANAANHYDKGQKMRLAADVGTAKPVATTALRAALISGMMAHRATRPIIKYIKKL